MTESASKIIHDQPVPSENFYEFMPEIDAESGQCNIKAHHDVPQDWFIVVSDITGSTKAVAEGRYKDVNIAASCAIVAALNAVNRKQVAYIYGGDGATLLIPPSAAAPVAAALSGTREMIRRTMGLGMHLGLVPVSDITEIGGAVKLAKIRTTGGALQASMAGNGLNLAERWVKDSATAAQFVPSALFDEKTLNSTEPDFSGFECRWNPVHSRSGTMMAVIIAAQRDDNENIYRDILAQIATICGSEDAWKPVSAPQLSVTASPTALSGETRVRTYTPAHKTGASITEALAYRFKVWLLCLFGIASMRFGIKAGGFDGKTYRQSATDHSDYLKFDNTLRFVMDVSAASKNKLKAYLDGLYRSGQIFYGTHESGAALMTCMVFDYQDDHVHFIDGADGGYSLAAKQLKAQIALAAEQAMKAS